MAIARVAARVAQRGHSIPEAVIRRRFEAGRKNFNSTYEPLANAWALYDNSQLQPVLIEEGVMDKPSILAETDPDLAEAGAALKRAARDARRLADQTDTPFIVFIDGKIVNIRKLKQESKSEATVSQSSEPRPSR